MVLTHALLGSRQIGTLYESPKTTPPTSGGVGEALAGDQLPMILTDTGLLAEVLAVAH